MKIRLILASFLLISISTFAQNIDHWEAIVLAENNWNYYPGTAALPNAWVEFDFDDDGWSNGPGGFGYSDGDDATVIDETLSVFLRKKFTITDLSVLEQAKLYADFDDSFVAYLNGEEIGRSGITGDFPAFDQTADFDHEATLYQGGAAAQFDLSINNFVEGENILAVQVHNVGINSSDLSSNFYLLAGITDDSNNYQSTPDWFNPPFEFTSSDLPIFRINTYGQEIVDEPDIVAELGIIYNGLGNLNSINDPANEYLGEINIEIRGESSQFFFDKKSYGIETIGQDGEDIDTSFLNFPKEEDWVMYGPFSDKTLMRNAITMGLMNNIGNYASRTRFVEVVVNGGYQGVYLIMEKIKKDNDRVDIATLQETDNEGVELTGGYIFRIDKGDPDWLSDYLSSAGENIRYQHVYPRADDITDPQKDYIKSYVDSFENAVFSPTYYWGGKRYDEYIDLISFADNLIMNELSKNVDGYRLSSYFHKKKDSNGGKIYAGPLWDFNLAWRNSEYCGTNQTQGWTYFEYCGNLPLWWQNMLEDEVFTDLLHCRYDELRLGPLHTDSIVLMIDENAALLANAQERNFQRYPILGEYIWPNPTPFAQTYDQEIVQLKDWTIDRLEWMDANMFGQCIPSAILETQAVDFEVIPNPTQGIFTLKMNEVYEISSIQIKDISGQIQQEITNFTPINNSMLRFDISQLTNGIYFACITTENGRFVQKIVKVDDQK